MPKFNDSENKVFMVPEGDYEYCVVEFDCGISNGKKTSGSDSFDLKLEIAPKGSFCFETLTDHESCSWKIDCFLKSAGITLKKGEDYEFRKDRAEARGVRWISPLGLRGWCRLIVDEYQGKKKNKVGVFYTDKPKLEPRKIVEDKEPF